MLVLEQRGAAVPAAAGAVFVVAMEATQRDAMALVRELRRTLTVDVDLEAFFDRVNHDILMSRLAARVTDKRMLGIIRHDGGNFRLSVHHKSLAVRGRAGGAIGRDRLLTN